MVPSGEAAVSVHDEEADRVARWTGPPRRLTVDAEVDRGAAVADPAGFDAHLTEVTRQAVTDLDWQMSGLLERAPAGTWLCVHGPEMIVAETSSWGVQKITVRVRVHQLDDDGQCAVPGTGGRARYLVPPREL